jgi:hypothetical protein
MMMIAATDIVRIMQTVTVNPITMSSVVGRFEGSGRMAIVFGRLSNGSRP